MHWHFLIAFILTAFAGTAQAHVGDRLYSIFELTDEDLAQINLHDGSADDWRRVIGVPSLTTHDFALNPYFTLDYDPEDLDFKIWLGWHQATSRIYVAMESSDDIYFNEYVENIGSSPFVTNWGMLNNDSMHFMVDGDHSGGGYEREINDFASIAEWKQAHYAQAQGYGAIAVTSGSRHIDLLPFLGWFARPPYADGDGGIWGTEPTHSVIEFYVTAFDNLVKDPQTEAVVSSLSLYQVVGFSIVVPDYDSQSLHAAYLLPLSLGPASAVITADGFADGLLVGKVSGVSVVESDSWGRIKASFGK